MKQRNIRHIDEAPPPKMKRSIPFSFVLDLLSSMDPVVKPMFGCFGVYVNSMIVLILRDREEHPEANGVWLATHKEHHATLRKDFPTMRSVELLSGGAPTNWQMIHVSDTRLEEYVTRACELILKGDPRIGSRPKKRAPRRKR